MLGELLSVFKGPTDWSRIETLIDDVFHRKTPLMPFIYIAKMHSDVIAHNKYRSDKFVEESGERYVLLYSSKYPDVGPMKFCLGHRVIITKNEYGIVNSFGDPVESDDDEEESDKMMRARRELVKCNSRFGMITNLVAATDDKHQLVVTKGDFQVFDVTLDEGNTVTVFAKKTNGKYFVDVAHGYASTLYAVQGLGFDVGKKVVINSRNMNPREMMTAISRLRSSDDLFWTRCFDKFNVTRMFAPIEHSVELQQFITLLNNPEKTLKRTRNREAIKKHGCESPPKRRFARNTFGPGTLKL